MVIDRKLDKNADTGMFELVYKQIIPPAQPYMGQNLIVRGIKIESPNKTKQDKKKIPNPTREKSSNGTNRLERYSDKLILVRNRIREKSHCFNFTKYTNVNVKPSIKVTKSGNLLTKKKHLEWQKGLWKTNKENTFVNINAKQQLPFVNDTFKPKPSSPVTKNNSNPVLPKIVTENHILT